MIKEKKSFKREFRIVENTNEFNKTSWFFVQERFTFKFLWFNKTWWKSIYYDDNRNDFVEASFNSLDEAKRFLKLYVNKLTKVKIHKVEL